jgi:hypothetical protein
MRELNYTALFKEKSAKPLRMIVKMACGLYFIHVLDILFDKVLRFFYFFFFLPRLFGKFWQKFSWWNFSWKRRGFKTVNFTLINSSRPSTLLIKQLTLCST